MSKGRESKNTTRNIFAGLISSNEETAPTSNLDNAPIAGKKPKRVSFGRRITIHQPASSTSAVGSSSSMKMPSPVPTPSPLPPDFYNETHTIFDQFRQQQREIQEEKKGEDDENEKSSEEEETTFDEPNRLFGSPTLQLQLTASDGSTNSGDEQRDHGEMQHDDQTYHKTGRAQEESSMHFDLSSPSHDITHRGDNITQQEPVPIEEEEEDAFIDSRTKLINRNDNMMMMIVEEEQYVEKEQSMVVDESKEKEKAATNDENNAEAAAQLLERITIHQHQSVSSSAVASSSSTTFLKMPSSVPTAQPPPLSTNFLNDTHTKFDQLGGQQQTLLEDITFRNTLRARAGGSLLFDVSSPSLGFTQRDNTTITRQERTAMLEEGSPNVVVSETKLISENIVEMMEEQSAEGNETNEQIISSEATTQLTSQNSLSTSTANQQLSGVLSVANLPTDPRLDLTDEEFEKVWEAEMCQLEDEYVPLWEEVKAKKERFRELDQKIVDAMEVLENRMQSWREQNEQFEQDYNADINKALEMANALQRK